MKQSLTKLAAFICFFLILHSTYAQPLTVQSDLDFLVNKIKHTYVGYNKTVHESDIDKIINEIRASDSKDTFANLSKLTLYFNDCHFTLFERVKDKLINADTNECKRNLEMISNSVKEKSKQYSSDGYWINEANTVIIYLRKKNTKTIEAYVIESKNNTTRGLINIKLYIDLKKNIVADYINIDKRTRLFTKAYFKNKKVLLIGSHCRWSKLDNYYRGMLNEKTPTDFRPAINVIDSNNIVFIMKDFGIAGRKVYDSVVKANINVIEKAKTLIIDARNNGGGGYGRMFSILPYICTKPIVTCDAYIFCSQDLIDDTKRDIDYYIKLKDSANTAAYKDWLDTLIAHKDSLNFQKGDTLEFTIKPSNIKNVAVLYSATSRSAAELMIMYLMQSSKVTTFGERSGGVVDNLETIASWLPSNKYSLWTAISKRIPTKQYPLYDKTGIKPDIEISDDELDWIDFVKKYYEHK